ncbi:hypothetical protein QYF61_015021, partial [Mycteria americana]
MVTGPEAPCILGIDSLRGGYFKDPKGYWWAFGVAAMDTENIKQLSTLPGLLKDASIVGLLQVEEQQVAVATMMVDWWQYCTNRDSLVPIHELIHQLESQPLIVPYSQGWRLAVDYRDLNEVTSPPSVARRATSDVLELPYELESKAAKWYATNDITNAFFSVPVAAERTPRFAFMWRGVQDTWNRLCQGRKHSPTICHGLIQTALEQGDAPERLQYIDYIIVMDAEEGLRPPLLQILVEGLLVRNHRNPTVNAPTRSRGSLTLAGRMKGTTGFTAPCGINGPAHRTHGLQGYGGH